MAVLTKEMLKAGQSRHGGWSRAQVALLGVKWPLLRGWQRELIGMFVSDETVDEFVAMKDLHLKPKYGAFHPKVLRRMGTRF